MSLYGLIKKVSRSYGRHTSFGANSVEVEAKRFWASAYSLVCISVIYTLLIGCAQCTRKCWHWHKQTKKEIEKDTEQRRCGIIMKVATTNLLYFSSAIVMQRAVLIGTGKKK